jgi:coenzyme F420-reducing hydrogenase alpha subunit
MLLVQSAGHKRQVCGTCAWAVAQSLAGCRALDRSFDNRNDPMPTALRQILDQPVVTALLSTAQHP